MAAVTVKLSNDMTDAVKKASRESIERALEKCGLIAEGYAKQYITRKGAVDTGRLRNSITHACGSNEGVAVYQDNNGKTYYDGSAKSKIEESVMYVGTNVEYAPYIEFGTSKMKPRTYIKPSIADHIDQYKEIIKGELIKQSF